MMRSLLAVALLACTAAVPAAAQWTKGGVPQQIGEADIAPMRDVVLAVEQKLQQLGYRVTPDGTFDAELGNTVLAYQRDRGLRPTGNIDLYTLASLGIPVHPGGATTAMVREPGEQYAMADERQGRIAAAPRVEQASAIDFPILKDEHMSAPQTQRQASPVENSTGVPLSPQVATMPGAPGFPPAYADVELY